VTACSWLPTAETCSSPANEATPLRRSQVCEQKKCITLNRNGKMKWQETISGIGHLTWLLARKAFVRFTRLELQVAFIQFLLSRLAQAASR
jgi:hypothetical protein